MDAGIKKEWIEALRSGKYPQAQDRLRSSQGFCCLGVLEDVMRPSTGATWETNTGNFDIVVPRGDDGLGGEREDTSLTRRCSTIADIPGSGELGLGRVAHNSELKKFILDKLSTHGKVLSTAQLNMLDNASGLMGLNDAGVPFIVIADIIENYL